MGVPHLPRQKKKAPELTTDEAMRRLFPARVITEAKKVANPPETKGKKRHV
jgi:hypothetical protein